VNAGALAGLFQRRPRFLAVPPSLTVKVPTQPTILTGLRLPGRGGSLATGSIVPQPGPLTTLRDLLGIPEKRKVFVSYHHHGDQAYKNALMERYCDDYELLEDNSLQRIIDTDDLQYVEREIREDYIRGSSVTILLCGARTWERKFVDWEIYATLLKKAGVVGLQLPTLVQGPLNPTVTVPARFHDNIATGYALWRTWSYMVANPGILRAWVEEAVNKDSWLIDNTRPKMRRNGEVRVHP
jgi:hypothetical protein